MVQQQEEHHNGRQGRSAPDKTREDDNGTWLHHLGLKSNRLEANALRLEAIALRLEAIVLRCS